MRRCASKVFPHAVLVFCAVVSMNARQVPATADMKKPQAEAEKTPTPKPADPPQPSTSASLTINLAGSTTQDWPIQPGTYKVTLVNTIPGQNYAVIVGSTTTAQLEPLPTPSNAGVWSMMVTGPQTSTAKPCADGIESGKALVTAKDETEVPGLLQRVQSAILSCQDEAMVAALQKLASNTTTQIPNLQIEIPDEARRTVSVIRKTVWTIQFSTMSRGKWQTMYGWTMAPNRDEDYFSAPSGEKAFTITRRTSERGSLTSLPSIFWTWLPADQAFHSLQHGVTAGIGVTIGDTGGRPAVFAGYSLRYNQNIGAVFGATVYPHRRLDGKYAEGETIETSLESDQLNRNSLQPNAFLGVILRFGSDPRKAPEKEGKGGDTPAKK